MLDPKDPDSFSWKTTQVSGGHQYRYIDQCPTENVSSSTGVVLCLHGFPDLAFGWRYQIIDLVVRGYRVIAPDLLGYGGTSKPNDLRAYTKLNVCKALVQLLEHERITDKVIVAAHDWGSVLGSRFVQYFPEKVKCWVTICVPPYPPSRPGLGPQDFVALVRTRRPQLGYQLYFMSPESNQDSSRFCKTFLLLAYYHWGKGLDSAIEKKLTRFEAGTSVFEGVFQQHLKDLGDELESVDVKDPELRYYLSEFKKNGLDGPLNWYRTRSMDEADEQAVGLPVAFPSDIPCLLIAATNDPSMPSPIFPESLKNKLFPYQNFECVAMQGGTHFLLQNPAYRDEVTKVLGDWIDAQQTQKSNARRTHL